MLFLWTEKNEAWRGQAACPRAPTSCWTLGRSQQPGPDVRHGMTTSLGHSCVSEGSPYDARQNPGQDSRAAGGRGDKPLARPFRSEVPRIHRTQGIFREAPPPPAPRTRSPEPGGVAWPAPPPPPRAPGSEEPD